MAFWIHFRSMDETLTQIIMIRIQSFCWLKIQSRRKFANENKKSNSYSQITQSSFFPFYPRGASLLSISAFHPNVYLRQTCSGLSVSPSTTRYSVVSSFVIPYEIIVTCARFYLQMRKPNKGIAEPVPEYFYLYYGRKVLNCCNNYVFV